MHVVVFGLTMSSSWGNGHATLWRGLSKALARRGHSLTFFERDTPYYASTRDGWEPLKGVRLRIYADLNEVWAEAKREADAADVVLVTSYCADARSLTPMLLQSRAEIKGFYDLDTPVTLDALRAGTDVPYLPVEGLRDFDLVLSYTGGAALTELQTRLGARMVAPLYGWVDPDTHAPAAPMDEFRADLSYLGTFAADRQAALTELFVRAAEAQPERRFALAGAQYPDDFPWTANTFFVRHLPPSLHPAFFSSSRLTLNVTRAAMKRYGYCPSGRLFEAAACGVPIVTDTWAGLETFFEPGIEILPVATTEDVCEALALSEAALRRVAEAARARTMECHTADERVLTLEGLCEQARLPMHAAALAEG